MSLSALIAEDEPILAATLAKSLERLWPELALAGIAANGEQGVAMALQHQPDILFLDIKMPGKSGLEAAEEIANQWDDARPLPQIVFVTAYDHYALEAFEHAAADYVLKPISDERLAKTIERLRARMGQPDTSSELARLLGQLRTLAPSPAPIERLSIIRAAVGNQVRMIPVGEVIMLEALDKYINVITADSEALIRTSLRELLPQLDDKLFWQVHRGTVVNSGAILAATREENGKLSLTLRGRPERPRVSPLYAHLFKQM